MPIKIPQAQAIQMPGSTAARVALGVGQQAAAALGQLAGSIEGVGANLEKVALQIAEADNVKHIAEAELDVHEASMNYLKSLENDYDEDTWVPGAKSMFNSVKESIMGRNLSPSAKRRIETKLGKLEMNFTLKVGSLASNQILARAKEAGLLASEVAIANADLGAYYDAINDMAGAGIISPEEASRMEFEGGRKVRTHQLQELVLANPQEAKKSVESGDWDDVSPSARSSALYKASVEENKIQREFYNEMSFALEKGEIPSEDQIMSWKEDGLLDPGQSTAMLQRARAKSPPKFDARLYMRINRLISNYNPNTDDEAQSELTSLMGDVYASGLTGSSLTKLKTKMDAAIRGRNTPAASVRREMLDVLQFYSDSGSFGKVEGDLESEKLSSDVEAGIIDELDAWLLANPDTDLESGRKAAEALIAPLMDAVGADNIMRVEPGAVTPIKKPTRGGSPPPLPTYDDLTDGAIDATLFGGSQIPEPEEEPTGEEPTEDELARLGRTTPLP